MMVAVALTAVACAVLPCLRVDPTHTLAAATFTATTVAVASRGRDRWLNRGAFVLFLITSVVAVAQEAHSLSQSAAKYRRLSTFHANQVVFTRRMVRYWDQYPDQFRHANPWRRERPGWLSYAERENRLASKYQRIARNPWLPVEPDTIGP
jgi:hypothetical protein